MDVWHNYEMEIIDVLATHPDFIELVNQLDEYYLGRYGDACLRYAAYHKNQTIQNASLLYIKEKAVACGSFCVFDSKTIELKRVYVLPENRRKGYAGTIVRHLERYAFSLGFRSAVLQTGAAAKDAIELYRSLGYQFIPNFGIFENDGICVCMKKQLEEED